MTRDEQIVAEFMDGVSTKEIAHKYGYKQQKSVRDILRKYGYSPSDVRNGQHNETLIDMSVIDSIEKAYYVGLMMSDGYITRGRYVGLDMKDEDVMKFVSELVHRPLNHYGGIYRVIFASKVVTEQMSRFGVVPNKSFIIQPPSLHDDEMMYIPYIMRGFIDGNGWISSDGCEFFVCTMSADLIGWLHSTLCDLGMTNISITRTSNGAYQVRSAVKHNMDVLKSIYGEPLGMMRKYGRLWQTFREHNGDYSHCE